MIADLFSLASDADFCYYFNIYAQMPRNDKDTASYNVQRNAICGGKVVDNRKGCTQWETKAARRIRTKVRNRSKGNRIKRQKKS